MKGIHKPKITLFHCSNAFSEKASAPFLEKDDFELNIINLPCSSLVKDVFLLRAFEAGSDAVVVLVCPEDHCRHIQGSLRARKRVERTKAILDEIGLDGNRLSIFNITPNDQVSAAKILQETLDSLFDLGPVLAAA